MDSLSPDNPAESLLSEDFGQKVDLTRKIREVLLNYPEGTTVLKELIQNADDAGATKVCLCLDCRVHAADSLLSDKLAQWKGPALLAYNNAEFTEDDFASISRIGGSGKLGQAWKTGRFGVGFNLTDLPSFVSGKYVVMFDPQGVYLPNVSTANPGKRIEYEKSDMAVKEADTAKAAWQCRVCLSNEVDITIVPCGHVLCWRRFQVSLLPPPRLENTENISALVSII